MQDKFGNQLHPKDVIVYKVADRYANLHIGVVLEILERDIKVEPIMSPVYSFGEDSPRRGKATKLGYSNRIALYDTRLLDIKTLAIVREIQDEL